MRWTDGNDDWLWGADPFSIPPTPEQIAKTKELVAQLQAARIARLNRRRQSMPKMYDGITCLECDRQAIAKDRCQTHYMRWKRKQADIEKPSAIAKSEPDVTEG